MNEEALFRLPEGSVLFVCGAGGKTTLIHRLRDYYVQKGRTVLVTTTTHMMREEGMCGTLEEILMARDRRGCVFAGRVDPKNEKKAVALPQDLLTACVSYFSVTLVEADGSRRLPFKAPYPHEPVIMRDVTHIALVGGMRAAGCRIRETGYNAESICRITGKDPDAYLTPEDMGEVYRRTYLRLFSWRYPGIPVTICPEQTAGKEEAARRFLRETQRRDDSGPRFHVIYLAAGYSVRYGGNKLLEEKEDGRPMYRALLDRMADLSDAHPGEMTITVVTQYPEIVSDLAALSIRCVVNPDPSRGISSSLQTGIRALLDDRLVGTDDFLLFCVADQPHLKETSVAAFLSGLILSGRDLGCFSHDGEFGNPCAFRSSYIPKLMALTGDRGGKRILLEEKDAVYAFSGAAEEELQDIDRKTC